MSNPLCPRQARALLTGIFAFILISTKAMRSEAEKAFSSLAAWWKTRRLRHFRKAVATVSQHERLTSCAVQKCSCMQEENGSSVLVHSHFAGLHPRHPCFARNSRVASDIAAAFAVNHRPQKSQWASHSRTVAKNMVPSCISLFSKVIPESTSVSP